MDCKNQRRKELRRGISAAKCECVYDGIGLILSLLAFAIFACGSIVIGIAKYFGNFISCLLLIIVLSSALIFFTIRTYIDLKEIKELKEELKRIKQDSSL